MTCMCSIPCIKANLFSCRNQQMHNYKDVQLYNFIYYTDTFRSLVTIFRVSNNKNTSQVLRK